ncbi:MAG: hypothetical protein NC417_02225 [Candidatus Gastranaerophilales bacterium]|nr:hypothetical protein [Candidatus Gastranaerophilales bacterium]
MRRTRSVMAAAVGMLAAMAMIVGAAMPKVHASSIYRPEDVTTGVTTVETGDHLAFPTWEPVATQGMEIRYLDENGYVIKTEHTSDRSDYVVLAYSALDVADPIYSDADVCWVITTQPTEEPLVLRWDLFLSTGGGVSSGDAGKQAIRSPGDYELQTDKTYILENGICRVQGDATVYASPVEFTVSTAGKYQFFY